MPSASAAVLAVLVAASGATPLLTIEDPAVTESSGLVRSVRHPTLLWTHNDGGEVADIYGVDPRGRTVARLRLRGIDPYDPEALARGRDGAGRPALFLGDIGDNDERRPDVSVFRVTEPAALGRQTVDATWFRFRYPDGAHDAEALLVDPRDGRLWVATKSLGVGGLYRAPERLVEQSAGTNELTRVADVPPLVTDGTFLAGGRFVLRTYTSVYVYDRPGAFREQIAIPIQEQGESVALDGSRLLIGSEGRRSPVLAVRLPDDLRAGRPGSSAGASGNRSVASTVADPARPWLWAVAGATILLLAAVAVRRRRRG